MTIADIARLSKTSVATVSRVINNDVHVRPDTRKRVQKVIEENNFRPNFAGKNLRQNKTFQVLAILPSITNPFFSHVIDGFSDIAARYGYALTFVVSNRNADKERAYLDKLGSKIVDGIVLFYPSLSAEIIESYGKDYPVVCLGSIGTQKVSRVGINDFDAALEGTQYLIGLGHRRIAVIQDKQRLKFNEERENGFRVAMRRAGIPVDESIIFRCEDKKAVSDSVEEAMRLFCPPTAFFSFSDVFAMSAMKYLIDHGSKVGEEVSVMGFDNIEFCQYVTPTLTTVSQPGYQMGESAFKLLLEKMEDLCALPKEIVFPHEIVVRDSTSLHTDKA